MMWGGFPDPSLSRVAACRQVLITYMQAEKVPSKYYLKRREEHWLVRCSPGKALAVKLMTQGCSGTHVEGGGNDSQVLSDFRMHCLTFEHLWPQINAKEKKLKAGGEARFF